MSDECTHADAIRDVTPSALGCEECLKIGSPWVHLRLCRTCGHVGCCDDSPNRHATKHFRKTRHPIIEGYDPPQGWGWCYVDQIMLDLSDRAIPQGCENGAPVRPPTETTNRASPGSRRAGPGCTGSGRRAQSASRRCAGSHCGSAPPSPPTRAVGPADSRPADTLRHLSAAA